MLRTTATRIVGLRATARTATIRYNKRPCSYSSVIITQLRLFSNEKDAIFIAKSLVRSLSASAADDTDTTRTPPSSGFTWVQLYRGGHMVGLPIEIVAATRNVSHLTNLVKEIYPELNDISSACLVVYPPGTPLDALNHDGRLRPGGPVPGGTTDEQPLMVMAPAAAAVSQLGKCL
jgi:hypothetical protein